VLISRLVDRALRPLFPADFHAETAMMISLISSDPEVMADSLAGLAASAALAVSDVPFEGYISEVRVARIDGKFIVNPTYSQLAKADLDIMVGASYNNIMMVEGEMDEVSEEVMLEAIKVAHDAIKIHCKAQEELAAMVGKTKRAYSHEVNDASLKAKVFEDLLPKAYALAKQLINDKHQRIEGFHAIVEEYVDAYILANAGNEDLDLGTNVKLIKKYYHDVEKEAMRRMILDDGVRLDGRSTTQIRPI